MEITSSHHSTSSESKIIFLPLYFYLTEIKKNQKENNF